MIVSLISVTAPLRASARPFSVTPSFIVIDVSARMLPARTVVGPERGGAADLPEDVAGLRAVDELHAAAPRR